MAFSGGVHKGRPAVTIGRIEFGPVLQEQCHDFAVAIDGGPTKRGFAEPVLGIDLGTFTQ